jgi:hypothetical protein
LSVIVGDDVGDLAGRDRALDRFEQADEFLMPVALPAAAIIVPSSTSRAANSLVVPLRL